jgi:hypothetical protein
MSKERKPQAPPSVSEELENNITVLEHYIYALMCMNESQSTSPHFEKSKDFMLQKSVGLLNDIKQELGICII